MSPEFEASLLRILENQTRMLEEFTRQRNVPAQTTGEGSSQQNGHQNPEDPRRQNQSEFVIESLSSGIHEFNYDPEAGKSKEVTFAETVNTLNSIFGRHTSLFNLRYQCLQLQKNQFDDFYTYAGIVNERCEEFKLSEIDADQFKCLLFVCGLSSCKDADIRTSLLSKIESSNPTMPMTLRSLAEECQRLLNLKRDTAMIGSTGNKPSVHAVKHTHYRKSSSQLQSETPNTPCWRCGEMHYSKFCPYQTHECKTCKQIGHKDGYCACFKPKSRRKRNNKPKRPKAQAQGIYSVNQVNIAAKRKFVHADINGTAVKLQLDSAADISIISEEVYKQLGSPPGKQPSINVVNASGDSMGLIKEFPCTITLHDVAKEGRCFVSNASGLNLFGAEWIELFGLWDVPFNAVCRQISTKCYPQAAQLVDGLQKKFVNVFSDQLGLCSKKKVSLTVKPGAKPVFRQKRPVPYASTAKIEEELERLQNLGIITPVSYAEWAAPIVAVRKPNGKVRICADYSTGLNEALIPNQHPLPLPQDIFAKLAGKKFFSQIDLSDAYLQVEVCEFSKKLLTINTHKGLFQFNRLSPGVKTASGEFQHIVDNMIADLEDTSGYLDDIIVASDTLEGHISEIERLLRRIEEYGFHLKIEKSTFFMQQIKYLGFIIDAAGIRPDPSKVKAIIDMPAPKDVSTLRSFLGAINYYGKFVRSMHDLRHPLDALLKKEVKWNWSEDCQKSFDKFKKLLQSDLLLTHYNPKLEMIVAADASQYGIGAVLLHRFPDGSIKAVCHASRTLTSAEKNYSQGEKEGLALIFACTKFHRMIFGRHFTLHTDHKPLLGIFGSKKGVPVHTASRLQRWALVLLQYDFKIEFKSTESFGHADVLSRLIGQHSKPDEDYVIASMQLEADIRSVQAESVAALPVDHQMILHETKQDRTLQKVLQFIRSNWPSSTSNADLLQFFKRKDSFCEIDECVM
ncbi:uncharacterized protein K02A2.6-like [Uranotaenia lowii]|uniref:uncharacterized protein K02A2.6-like n=1 Tax=Uranotaenia lowii TaxID=190385 RepID=UPI002478A8A6|nr:uncharacterized protein K02A2.6-like [Uranotaenia lowii]